MTYNGPERRQNVRIPDEEFERLVKAAAKEAKEMALRDIYIAVGKSVVSKILWLFGLAAAAVWAALKFKQ